ncbi:MAG: hypothetical protein EXQ86_10135 [Rhodospirillales bacterium]|nr:hypothetical protein [Rhodospirillales bacterium]
MLRLAANLRNQMLAAGFTDNGGAIHSAERILNILGMFLKYPDLNHINNLRSLEKAKFSVDGLAAHERGEKVLIEHVSPIRDLTRRAIQEIGRGVTDAELESFIRTHYELVLLTPDEAVRLNRLNRSRMEPDRLARAGIHLASQESN